MILPDGRSPPLALAFVAAALITIAAGLWVHLAGAALGSAPGDVIGDALWAMMMAWWLGALLPRVSLRRRSALAYAICVAVELSPLFHGTTIDALRYPAPGRLVLGSGVDPRDLLAYGAGVAAAALVEWWWISQVRKRARLH